MRSQRGGEGKTLLKQSSVVCGFLNKMEVEKRKEHKFSNLKNLKLDEKYYERPSWVTTENPETYKCGSNEKLLGKACKISDKAMASDQSVQKRLKGRVMGMQLLKKLIEKGQGLVVTNVLKFLGWLDFALLLLVLGPQIPQLIYLSQNVLEQILVDNTPVNYCCVSK